MPRDGSNIYHKPAGTDGVPNTTVQSTPYNSYTANVEQDLNTPRPIVAGGTAATSADLALINLSAEKFKQVVTNWDSMTWMAGSFYAATSATGAAPVAGHAFAGLVYYADATNFVLEAIDLTDAAHLKYVRVMAAGVWGAWAATNLSLYVQKAGDTMTGPLTVNGLVTINNDLTLADATPTINLNKVAGGNAAGLVARTGANIRWLELLGDTTAESGSNLGSDFVLQAYTDAGAPVVPPTITAKRSLNRLLLAGDPVAALDAATKQYADAGDAAITAALISTVVRYDIAQALSALQQQQARQNVYAAPFDALAFNGMQCNGAMEVSQEVGTTATALTTATGKTITDQWIATYTHAANTAVFQAFQGTAGPPGFSNCLTLKATTLSAMAGAGDNVLCYTQIEGYRTQRLGFGAAGASPITIGFWVQTTIAGTMAVAIRNIAANRSYVVDVVINNPNTWEYKTVTIPGDVTGTWATGTSYGLVIFFCFGTGSTYRTTPNAWAAGFFVGTTSTTNFFASNNNQASLTGVIVLPGNEAPVAARSPFIMRPFDEELHLCQRYWEKSYDYTAAPGSTASSINGAFLAYDVGVGGVAVYRSIFYKVRKRIGVLVTPYSYATGAANKVTDISGPDVTPAVDGAGETGCRIGATYGTANTAWVCHWTANAR